MDFRGSSPMPIGDFSSSLPLPFAEYREAQIIGISLIALLILYFWIVRRKKQGIEREVKLRTQELAEANDLLRQEVAQKKRFENDLIKKQRYLKRHHEALEYLHKFTISELPLALNEVLLRTAGVMQIDRAGIWFYEESRNENLLTCAALYLYPKNPPDHTFQLSSKFFPRYFQALEKHTSLVIPVPDDPELNEEMASYLTVFHVTSKLDIPIVFEGKLLGVLFCEETRNHREWYLEDRHFGQTIADIIAIMIEQSARRKAEKALQESEDRLQFITQNAIDGIVSVNERGEIISWNYGAEQMFGFKEKEILEKPLRSIIPAGDLFREEIAVKPLEIQGRHSGGNLFPVEVSHTRWKKGERFYDTIIIRDITERKENEKRLIKAMREARAANAAKSEFLATISHEVRTPLNAIIGFDQCLLMGMDGPLNPRQEESLKKIEKSSLHLLTLIDDVLDLAKIEANKMELELVPQNIVEVLDSCIEEMKPLAQAKSLEFFLNVAKPFILVEIDKMRVRQVILNLMSNAVKFTEKGSIKITLIHLPEHVRIEVTDTGIGLTPEEIGKIFRPFSQADTSITRKYGGTGLGLVISKRIVELHGGKIFVTSKKGEGSTFGIVLPKTQ